MVFPVSSRIVKKTALRMLFIIRPILPTWAANCRLASASVAVRVGLIEFSKRASIRADTSPASSGFATRTEKLLTMPSVSAILASSK